MRLPLTEGRALNNSQKSPAPLYETLDPALEPRWRPHVGRREWKHPPPRPTLATVFQLPARGASGSCLCAGAVIGCLLFGWMSCGGAHGARFWHNDWLQSCGSPLRNPTVATVAPWRLSITGKTNVQSGRDGEEEEEGVAGLFQWQHNCYPVLQLSRLTETLVDTRVINPLVIMWLVNNCFLCLKCRNGSKIRYFHS